MLSVVANFPFPAIEASYTGRRLPQATRLASSKAVTSATPTSSFGTGDEHYPRISHASSRPSWPQMSHNPTEDTP